MRIILFIILTTVIVENSYAYSLNDTDITSAISEVEHLGISKEKNIAYIKKYMTDDFVLTVDQEIAGMGEQIKHSKTITKQGAIETARLFDATSLHTKVNITSIDITDDKKNAHVKYTQNDDMSIIKENADGRNIVIGILSQSNCSADLVSSESNYPQIKMAYCRSMMSMKPFK